MVDFLKANPFMTIEDYLWKYSIPMIKIMAMDNSHVNYLGEKEAKGGKRHYEDVSGKDVNELNKALGINLNF